MNNKTSLWVLCYNMLAVFCYGVLVVRVRVAFNAFLYVLDAADMIFNYEVHTSKPIDDDSDDEVRVVDFFLSACDVSPLL